MTYFSELVEQHPHDAAAQLADQSREIERLRRESDHRHQLVVRALVRLREVGDDYPGSSCQQWCRNEAAKIEAELDSTAHQPTAAQYPSYCRVCGRVLPCGCASDSTPQPGVARLVAAARKVADHQKMVNGFLVGPAYPSLADIAELRAAVATFPTTE